MALPATGLAGLELQPSYGSLHALLKDLGLLWLERGGTIEALPQALLRRQPLINPTLLAISTPNQRQLFRGDQLLELAALPQRRASAWLAPGGRLEPGPRQASFQLGPQHKLLKEPSGVAQVPFGRAGVGHPLEAEVLWLQGGHQGQALLAHPYVPRRQLLSHPAAANSG